MTNVEEVVGTATVTVGNDGACTLPDFVQQSFEPVNAYWQEFLHWLTAQGAAWALNVVFALVLLIVGAWVIRWVGGAVRKVAMRGGAKRELLANFAVSVVTKTCWAFLVVTALARVGVDVAPIIAGIGVTGFILGFAFQESLGNLASGLMIALNEPFKPGDFVTVAGLEGTISEVNMMATVLLTGDSKRIVIPNKSAWGGPIVNYSATGKRRVDIKVGVAYGTDIGKALALAEQAVKGVSGVLADPAPAFSIASLDDSAVTLNIRPWAATADYWAVHHGVQKAVLESFAAGGVSIPFPQIDVHLDK